MPEFLPKRYISVCARVCECWCVPPALSTQISQFAASHFMLIFFLLNQYPLSAQAVHGARYGNRLTSCSVHGSGFGAFPLSSCSSLSYSVPPSRTHPSQTHPSVSLAPSSNHDHDHNRGSGFDFGFVVSDPRARGSGSAPVLSLPLPTSSPRGHYPAHPEPTRQMGRNGRSRFCQPHSHCHCLLEVCTL